MRMRVIRSLVFASVSVMSFFVILSMLTNTTPASPTALHSLVTHTHNHLNHLQNNIKEEFESLVSGPDPEVLQQLGFVDKPVLYPHTNWTNLTTPVIVTAVSSSEIEAVENVVGVAAQVCPEANILIYTLDLSTKETALVELLCNDTCSVVAFDFSIYPSHVKNWRLQAYRPIIIQELLVRAGAVLWLDPTIRLVVTSSPDTEPRSRVNMSASFASGAASGQVNYLFASPTRDKTGKKPAWGERSPGKKPTSSINNSSAFPKVEEKTFIEFLDINANESGLQAVYPADQAALLNIPNRYVPVAGRSKASNNNHSEFVALTDQEVSGHGRSLLTVTFNDMNNKNPHQRRSKITKTSVRKKRSSLYKENTVVDVTKSEHNHDLNEVSKDEILVDETVNSLTNHMPIHKTGLDHLKNELGTVLETDVLHNINIDQIPMPATEQSVKQPILNSSQQRGTLLESLHINELSYASPKHSYASLRSTRLDEVSEDDCLLGAWRHEALLQRGVLAWQFSDPLMGRLPTAALTHPSMFSAMHTRKELYDFHQMSDAGAVLLYNTESVHRHLMKPWLMCSLSSHCVQPIGAQDTGCRFDKKPLFRYSGCHLYDASAFNVALGLMLGPHNHPHQPTSAVIFTRVPPTPAPGSDMGDISPSPQYTEPPVSNIRHLHRGTPRRWPLSSSPPLRNHSAAGSAVVVAGAGS
ncbi:uncharacterized protein LOC108682497 [Hyalella azteca]|uniref:Uncharacterized protein LOC108682497 n=1 Tax=Hyalella azteca TaxID=294128 RepID=A0A8B7PLT5_HYAAZ|nr:uncharacterized protein LOC108682497 [Hyalella azteca]